MMPTYTFEELETGRKIEVFMHMKDAPRIGDVLDLDGMQVRRLPELSQNARVRRDVHYTDVQMEPWTPGGPRYDADGMIQFDSMREVEEFHARKRDAGESVWIDR